MPKFVEKIFGTHSERELKKICKGATVVPGLAIHGAEAAQSESKVTAWAKKNV